ncbi:pentapeptide repeat-containing protein [Barrientosiimonas marina]|uniref:Pentapeptide repeat-containing protein n=1 Tax=Lentibacillus kimchii TaxID=1542911 RepID=A0ABW2UV12_9BACI
MKKRQRSIQTPDLPEQLDPLTIEELTDHASYEMGAIYSAIGPVYAEHVRFEQIYFKNVTFRDTALPFSEWLDVSFENCDLSAVNLQGARLNRVTFHHCKLAGADFDRAIMQDVTWIDCQAPYLICNETKLRDVLFERCLVKGANFIDASQENLQLGDADIEDVQFSGTSLQAVDLSHCQFTHIHVGEEELRGAVIAPEQASGFIELFGIRLNDQDT